MANARAAWGIDLGNRALKAVRLVPQGDRYRIDDFEVIEHDQILSTAGDNKESLLKTALANLVQRHTFKDAAVAVSVSGQSSFARFIKLPPVEPRKIPEIVRFEAIQQIPFPLDDVEWNYQLFQDKDSPDVEVGIFAMRKELVNRHIGYFTDLGLNVQVVQMQPLAVYNAMHYDDRVGQTTMFMDCGAENTDLIIADGQTVWLRTIPIGGNTFTEALTKSFKLNFSKAEELKRNAATSKYAKQIFQAMRPVFADVVAEIQRSIGFYASVHRDARIQKIVALGNTFQLPGLQKYLQQNLQIPVEKLDAFKAYPPTDARMAANLTENLIGLAGAYGLALQAMGEGKISSSLLPESIRRAKMWQEKTKWFGVAAAMFVLGAVGAASSYYYHTMMYEQNRPVREEIQRVKARASSLAGEYNSEVASKGAEDRDKILGLRALQKYRDTWPTIIKEVLASVPSKPLEQLKALRRADREIIAIDSITHQYLPDLTPVLAPTADFGSFVGAENLPTGMDTTFREPRSFGRAGQEYARSSRMDRERDPYGADAYGGYGAEPVVEAPKRPGFLVTIRGSTPHKEKSPFVQRMLVEKLKEMDAAGQFKGGKSWYVEKADLVRAGPRAVKDPRNPWEGGGMRNLRIERDIRRGPAGFNRGAFQRPFGRAVGGQVRPLDEVPEIDPEEDPLFPGEKITQDEEFVVLVAIALDPPSPEEIAEQEASEDDPY